MLGLGLHLPVLLLLVQSFDCVLFIKNVLLEPLMLILHQHIFTFKSQRCLTLGDQLRLVTAR